MIPRVFVDANVFLRFFVRDDEAQLQRAAELLQAAAEGKLSLVTGPPVLFEVAWTLRTSYGMSRGQVAERLGAIEGAKGLHLTDRVLVQTALQSMAKHGQEFADAYIQASAQAQGAALATFNRKDFVKAGADLHEL